MNTPKINVLAALHSTSAGLHSVASNTRSDLSTPMRECAEQVDAARIAIAQLIAAGHRTIAAFESLGTANDVVATLQARQQCERAMVAQKVALERVGGAA